MSITPPRTTRRTVAPPPPPPRQPVWVGPLLSSPHLTRGLSPPYRGCQNAMSHPGAPPPPPPLGFTTSGGPSLLREEQMINKSHSALSAASTWRSPPSLRLRLINHTIVCVKGEPCKCHIHSNPRRGGSECARVFFLIG